MDLSRVTEKENGQRGTHSRDISNAIFGTVKEHTDPEIIIKECFRANGIKINGTEEVYKSGSVVASIMGNGVMMPWKDMEYTNGQMDPSMKVNAR